MHKGHCHCGNVQLKIPHLSERAVSCNCSICSRYASIWGHFTESEVSVEIGPKGISAYSHGDKMINFNHCNECGCITHYTSTKPSPTARLSVNYRMFGHEIVQQLNIRHFDGADTWEFLD
jgi:hypothetical protein